MINMEIVVESGDIILFSRSCISMQPTGMAICLAAKFWALSQWCDIKHNESPYHLQRFLQGPRRCCC